MILGGLCTLVLVLPQAQAQEQEKPARLTFDVISIKPAKPGVRGGGIKALPGGQEYTAQNVPVKLMISLMYKVPMWQIKGGPEWVDGGRYDVEAKADHPYNLDDLHTMFRNLLADEFKLKFHRETKEGPVYALSVDKSGLKMKPNDSPQNWQVPIQGGPGHVVGKRVPMEYLTWWLSQTLQQDQRSVIDQTGLSGNYDFTLACMPELPPDFPRENLPPGIADLPTIFEALPKQLGLRLEPQKGPVSYFMIDSAERPAEN